MMREASQTVVARNVAMRERIEALKAAHPFWGCRRIWAHLRFTEGFVGNRTRILRVMQVHKWLVPANTRLRAKLTPTRNKPNLHRPNQWWEIDLTKVLVAPEGWLSIVLVLGWYTKKIGGCQGGRRSTAQDWLEAG